MYAHPTAVDQMSELFGEQIKTVAVAQRLAKTAN